MLRKYPIVTGHIYHIFNRGVNRGNIFFEDQDYKRFIRVATHYLTNNSTYSHTISDPVSAPVSESRVQRVLVQGYCLMPNHFHFLIKQLMDGGITWYMQHLANSYSHYIHLKYKRTGPLFDGRFKNILVETDEQLVHVSRYIHLNPIVSNLVSSLESYPWSSYLKYIDVKYDDLVDPDMILGYFKSVKDYKGFVLDQVEYGRELEKIKHLILDLEG